MTEIILRNCITLQFYPGMLRGKLFKERNTVFHLRGKDIQRIETFSDAIFAFSISLLIMSLEVPQTFKELEIIVHNFLPFVATVLLVALFWREQNRYFRHYGLSDAIVIWLNILLLVVILFYVYPLKFLFSLLLSMFTHSNYFPKAGNEVIIEAQDFPSLVLIYSVGYALIWLLFFLLYEIAWYRRDQLRLNKYERALTKKELRGAFLNACIGVSAMIFASLKAPVPAGICFLMIPLILWFVDWRMKKELQTRDSG